MMGVESERGGRAARIGLEADAIVVGSGPAGAMSALLLARAGWSVLLVDRARFPRPKPCGDCLSAAATGLLRGVGLLDRVRAAGAAEVDTWRIRSPAGVACDGHLDGEPALSLERRHLDAALRDAALDAGARPATGYVRDLRRDGRTGAVAGVRLRAPDGVEREVTARLVIGADGLRSIVARRLGLVRRRPRLSKVSLTTHGRLSLAGLRRGEMHVLAGGCFGFAPAGRGRFNLTLVTDAARAGRLRQVGPEAFLRERLQDVPALRDRIGDAALDPPLASGPFDWPVRSATRDGVALVGDAAGYFDPFTGQGIYHAVAGATMLVEEVAGACDENDVRAGLRRYAVRHRAMCRPARRVQWVVDVALRRPGRAERVLRRLANAPAAMNRLVEVTGNVRAPASLLSPSLVQSLVFPPSPEPS